jgi:YidC/Oxa1 family membrane protein insertase
MLLAIVLSIAAIWGYSALRKAMSPAPTTPPATTPTDGTPPAPAPGTTPQTPGADPAAPAPAPGAPAPAPGAPAPAPGAPAPAPAPAPRPDVPVTAQQETVLPLPSGEFLDVSVTTRGAALRHVRLRHSYELPEADAPKREPLDVLLPSRPDLLTGALSLDEADAEGLRTKEWTRVEPAPSPTSVAFETTTSTGLRIVKTFTFPTEPGRYDVGVEVRVERPAGTAPPPAPASGGAKEERVRLRLLAAAGLAKEPTAAAAFEEPVQGVVQVVGEHSEPFPSPWHVNPVAIDELSSRAFRLIGVKSQYFGAVLYSGGAADAPPVRTVWVDGGDLDVRKDYEASLQRLMAFYRARGREPSADPALAARLRHAAEWFHRAWAEFDAPLPAAGSAARPTTFRLFVGPLSRHVLGKDGYEPLRELIVYPMAFDFLARFLLLILDLFRWLTGSAGLAVLLMTLVVRGGLIPLSVRNQLSMRRHGRKVSRLKPKLEALKKKWANDPKKFREEQVKLFREHGIGFPLGCLMLLFQIPIFMALFASLRVEYDLRHEAFLWIRDLSGPDRLVDFGLTQPFFVPILSLPPGGIHALNLLPILYMGLAILQQRQMPKPLDEQQAQQMKMAKWMTIIFPILHYNSTAALALYMVVSSVVAIVESRLVRAKDAHDLAREAGAAA